jgi:hypothetical protein
MTKFLGSLCVAGMLLAGVIGCTNAPSTPKTTGGDNGKPDHKALEKALTDAKDALKKAEDALKDNKDEAKNKDLEKAVEEAKEKVKKAEEELKKAKA